MFIAKLFVQNKFNSVAQNARGAASGENEDGSNSGLDERGGVKWYDYNFPPYLNMIHYNPWHGDNIPLQCKKTASVVYVAYRMSVFGLIVNVGTNIAFVISGWAPSNDIIASIFQCIIVAILASLAFYWHYRGMAGEIRKEGKLYVFMEFVLIGLYLAFVIADYNNIHGYTAFGHHSTQQELVPVNGTASDGQVNHTGAPETITVDHSAQGAIWDIISVCEASWWVLTLLFSLGGLWRVWRYPGHAIAFRREQPVTAKTRKKGRAADLTTTELA